jgi:hypothetical protein
MMTAKRAATQQTNPVVAVNTLSEIEKAKQRLKDLEAKQKAEAFAAQAPLRAEYEKVMAEAKQRHTKALEELRAQFKARGLSFGAGSGVMSEAGKAGIAEGARLFALAGKPSRADIILVYGPKGPAWAWAQRAKAGVDAAHFQEALAAKRTN